MISFFAIAATLIALYGLHRLALWMETKGWIYYLRKRASPDTMGAAFLELQRMVQPDARHILEIKQNQRVEQHDQGEPKEPGKTGAGPTPASTQSPLP